MSLESRMRAVADLLRGRGHTVTYVDAHAVLPSEPGEIAPPNPDTGAGSEPGHMEMTVDGVVLSEDLFTRLSPTIAAVADDIEQMLISLADGGAP